MAILPGVVKGTRRVAPRIGLHGIADGDRVFTVDGSGSFLVDYTTDAVLLTSFQTAPVPEPQTWILLGAGLALLGAVKRRTGLRR